MPPPGCPLSPLLPPQVCGEKNRFEKLMEYFRNEDTNIDFMVSYWRGWCSAVPRALCPQGLLSHYAVLGSATSQGLPSHCAVPSKLCPQELLVHLRGAVYQRL